MLDVRDLGWRYPRAPGAALDGVSLSVARGEVLGLLGPNGAGKSTLVAHLAGLLPVRHGTIAVEGQPLADYRRRDPTRIAVAPQDYAFYPTLSVDENLRCFAAVLRIEDAAIDAALARVRAATHLDAHAGTRAERLSGGLKRRLNLAIALLAQPALLILDEPTVGVDAASRSELLATVKRLARAGVAIIYTTHYLEEIEAVADRVAILHRGRLLRLGRLADLLAEGASRVTVRFAAPPPAALVESLRALGTAALDGAHLTLELAPATPPLAALACIERSGVPVLEFHGGRATLEQLFIEITGEAGASC